MRVSTHLDEHLSPAEVAKRLGVSLVTVRRWIAEGRASGGRTGIFPSYKLGRKCVRVPAAAVNRMLKRQEDTLCH